MLRSIRRLLGYRVEATDGFLGRVSDVLLDDARWVVRYIEVLDGGGRSIVSVLSLAERDPTSRLLRLSVSRDGLERSPCAEAPAVIPADWEQRVHRFFQWPPYWRGTNLWSDSDVPVASRRGADGEDSPPTHRLVRAQSLLGSEAVLADGVSPHVADLLVEERSWLLTFFVLKRSEGRPSRLMVPAPALSSFDQRLRLETTVARAAGRRTVDEDRI